jgi:RNA polymerase sigma-70 factor, ECF subfamily
MARILPLRALDEHTAVPVASDALVDAMAAGDPQALGLLFDRYHRGVYAFVAAVGIADPHDLDDLVQETFLAAFKSASRFQRRSAVKTWLFGIGFNLARNHARARRVRRQTADRIEISGESPAAPDRCADARQQLARLADAIARLPADLRAAYVICVIENLSSDDAARILGIRKGTLWRRVHEARELLRVHIGRPNP